MIYKDFLIEVFFYLKIPYMCNLPKHHKIIYINKNSLINLKNVLLLHNYSIKCILVILFIF